ncbi:MAG: alpha/beta fold hydrolase [Planctomycetes bacterium]|nr:alpha/beta fold hydrolase [Planctomycetota bacterium]
MSPGCLHRGEREGRSYVLEERAGPAALGAVLLGHAMMTQRRSMDRPPGGGLASFLAGRGWRVFLVDMPGHGESGPRASEGADWSYDDLVRDMGAIIARVQGLTGGLPLVVLGHSLCGHLAINAQGLWPAPPVAGIVACAPGVWLPRFEPSRAHRLRKGLDLLVLEGVVRLAGRFPARLLGMGNEDEARTYLLQFCRWWRTGTWRSADGRLDYLEATARCAVPVLGVVAAGDGLLARPAAARAYLDYVGSLAPERRVEVLHCAGARLGRPGHDPDHMGLVTDPDSAPYWGEVAAWMEARARGE